MNRRVAKARPAKIPSFEGAAALRSNSRSDAERDAERDEARLLSCRFALPRTNRPAYGYRASKSTVMRQRNLRKGSEEKLGFPWSGSLNVINDG
jgi:hypothetical protein